MMTSYFNLLKYAATGQASPSMTYYDRMRASTLMGGVVKTLTGQPPLSFPSDGSPITIWSMIGNGEQSGTPSPQSIIMPTFCGVRTAQRFDKNNASYYAGLTLVDANTVTSATARLLSIPCKPNTTYTIRTTDFAGTVWRLGISDYSTIEAGQTYTRLQNGIPSNETKTFTTTANTKSILFQLNTAQFPLQEDYIMLNEGSTALPYEPFGWAEKITCAGQTVPVYLGEVPTVRRVKKLVLTGEEEGWGRYKQGDNLAYMYLDLYNSPNMAVLDTGICTHLEQRIITSGNSNEGFGIQNRSSNTKTSLLIRSSDMGMSSVDAFKTYLAQQYAAGTPVCVWYVLATPETGITNEPLAKIGTYADELHSEDAGVTIPTIKGQNTLTVDTPIQPSEMSITYRG